MEIMTKNAIEQQSVLGAVVRSTPALSFRGDLGTYGGARLRPAALATTGTDADCHVRPTHAGLASGELFV